MPKLTGHKVPSYRLHKQSGQAIVTLNGHDNLLGKYGTPASRVEYNRLIAEWLAAGRESPKSKSPVTVSEVISAFWRYAETYYRKPDGTPTSEQDNFRDALRPLRHLYAETIAAAFGPLALKALREEMIQTGWCRTHINKQVGRIKRVFKWAVENEMVPPAVHQGLLAVAGLKAGRSDARESAPVQPVSTEMVELTLPHVSRQIAAMVRLQLLSGMRPGEVCMIRGTDLDMSSDLWRYRPASHKTSHHGHERLIYFGARAQAIVRPFLKPDVQAYLFAPADAEAERRAELSDSRKTLGSCGHNVGSNRKRKPKKSPGPRYTVESYCRAIHGGCSAAFPPPENLSRQKVQAAGRKHKSMRWEKASEWKTRLGPKLRAELEHWREQHRWHPHQLRHTAATELRKKYGLEAAQVILGHQQLTVTQVYAEKNVAAAQQIMRQVG